MATQTTRRMARDNFEKAAIKLDQAARYINQFYPVYKERGLPQAEIMESVIKSCLITQKAIDILKDMT